MQKFSYSKHKTFHEDLIFCLAEVQDNDSFFASIEFQFFIKLIETFSILKEKHIAARHLYIVCSNAHVVQVDGNFETVSK